MKKMILAAVAIMLIFASSFAQTTRGLLESRNGYYYYGTNPQQIYKGNPSIDPNISVVGVIRVTQMPANAPETRSYAYARLYHDGGTAYLAGSCYFANPNNQTCNFPFNWYYNKGDVSNTLIGLYTDVLRVVGEENYAVIRIKW